MWLLTLASNGPVPNDWLHLKIVAEHFVSGEWDHLYSIGENALNPGYYWRYPPFALYFVAPLAWVPETWSYVVLAGVEILALVASLFLLQRLSPFRDMREEWALAIMLSAPALTTIITGQSSGLIMLCVVGAATLWSRERVMAACALLGLLAVKPNWGIVFGLYAVVRGEWRGAAVMLSSVALLCAATIPMGLQVWADFLGISMSNTEILADYESAKLITLKGFLESTLGKTELAFTLWALAATGLLVVTIRAWRTHSPPLRQLSLGLLLAVAVNPYASFYDALVLAVPATVWWAERRDWERRSRWIVGVLLAVAWGSEQWMYSWGAILEAVGVQWRPQFSLVGPAAALWLALAAHQATRGERHQQRHQA
jgi:hypothetical protein